MVQYFRSYQRDKWIIEKEQKVMHHAYFCRYRQGTVASFLNPDLTNKPWDVHFYCVLMVLREYLSAYDLP